jgi:hypothetical protein
MSTRRLFHKQSGCPWNPLHLGKRRRRRWVRATDVPGKLTSWYWYLIHNPLSPHVDDGKERLYGELLRRARGDHALAETWMREMG